MYYLERRIVLHRPGPILQNHGAYVGAFHEITDRVAPLFHRGRLIYSLEVVAAKAPALARAAQAAAVFDPAAAQIGWGEYGYPAAAVLGYQLTADVTRFSALLDELSETHRDELSSLYVDSLRLHLACKTTPRSAAVADLLPIARHMRQAGAEYGWVYLQEVLPAASRAGGQEFMQTLLRDVPGFIREEPTPFARFLVSNALALTARWANELEKSLTLLDAAQSELPRSAIDRFLLDRYVGLMDSNRAVILFDAGRTEEAAAAVTRAVLCAPSFQDRWLHSERGLRIADRLDTIEEWFDFLSEHGDLRPEAFDPDDVYYQARRYFSLIAPLGDLIAKTKRSNDFAVVARHAIALLDQNVPRWTEYKERLSPYAR
jgi:tetratricopeptide (TPR) repeat protein